MADNSADLASVLSTLSALSNTPIPTRVQSHEDDYEPPDVPPRPPAAASIPPRTPVAAAAAAAATAPTTDPTTITTWPPALRHIMQTVSHNHALQTRLRRLLRSQHDHERQWWEGREALCRKHRERAGRGREVEEVLRAVGAPVPSNSTSISTEQNITELKTYDRKIHAASTQMADALALELRGLGIPFFSLRRDLVYSQGQGQGQGQGNGKISGDELAILQRKMLELLQDLCKE